MTSKMISNPEIAVVLGQIVKAILHTSSVYGVLLEVLCGGIIVL